MKLIWITSKIKVLFASLHYQYDIAKCLYYNFRMGITSWTRKTTCLHLQTSYLAKISTAQESTYLERLIIVKLMKPTRFATMRMIRTKTYLEERNQLWRLMNNLLIAMNKLITILSKSSRVTRMKTNFNKWIVLHYIHNISMLIPTSTSLLRIIS